MRVLLNFIFNNLWITMLLFVCVCACVIQYNLCIICAGYAHMYRNNNNSVGVLKKIKNLKTVFMQLCLATHALIQVLNV